MNKPIIALAALTALTTLTVAGSAFAEITPYAIIDLALSSTTTTGVKDKGLEVIGNGYKTNRFGVKGSTDIGGNLMAFGQLEAGFDPNDDGSFTGNAWARVAKAGLSGRLGTIALGTDWSPYDNSINDALDYQRLSALAGVWSRGTSAHADRGNNATTWTTHRSIQYQTPQMGALSAVVMVAPNDKMDGEGNYTTYYGFGLNYNAGPLALSFATEHVPTSIQNPTLTVGFTDAWALTGSYSLGAAKLFFGYEEASADAKVGAVTINAKDKGHALGIAVPISPAMIFSLGYAYESTAGDMGVGVKVDNHASGIATQVKYQLNKIAMVYFGARQLVDTNTAGKDTTTNKYSAGLNFSF